MIAILSAIYYYHRNIIIPNSLSTWSFITEILLSNLAFYSEVFQTSLLFLLPPSCIIVPIGETVNKFSFLTSFSTTILSNNQQNLLPSVNILNNTEMDHFTETNPVINNNARGRSPQIHKNWSRDSSMSSTVSSTIYHEKIELNNDMDIDSDPPVESPMLSYEDEREKEICLRKVAETTNSTRLQGVNNEASSTQTNHDNYVSTDNMCVQTPCVGDDNVINI